MDKWRYTHSLLAFVTIVAFIFAFNYFNCARHSISVHYEKRFYYHSNNNNGGELNHFSEEEYGETWTPDYISDYFTPPGRSRYRRQEDGGGEPEEGEVEETGESGDAGGTTVAGAATTVAAGGATTAAGGATTVAAGNATQAAGATTAASGAGTTAAAGGATTAAGGGGSTAAGVVTTVATSAVTTPVVTTVITTPAAVVTTGVTVLVTTPRVTNEVVVTTIPITITTTATSSVGEETTTTTISTTTITTTPGEPVTLSHEGIIPGKTCTTALFKRIDSCCPTPTLIDGEDVDRCTGGRFKRNIFSRISNIFFPRPARVPSYQQVVWPNTNQYFANRPVYAQGTNANSGQLCLVDCVFRNLKWLNDDDMLNVNLLFATVQAMVHESWWPFVQTAKIECSPLLTHEDAGAVVEHTNGDLCFQLPTKMLRCIKRVFALQCPAAISNDPQCEVDMFDMKTCDIHAL